MMRQTVLSTGIPGKSAKAPVVISSLAGRRDHPRDEERAILSALGQLWTAGAEPDWQAFHAGYSRRRVSVADLSF